MGALFLPTGFLVPFLMLTSVALSKTKFMNSSKPWQRQKEREKGERQFAERRNRDGDSDNQSPEMLPESNILY